MSKYIYRLRWVLLAVGLALAGSTTSCSTGTDPDAKKWRIVWQDEFDGPEGQLPDSAKWHFDIGTGWGNRQLEYDTNRPENAALDGQGHLAIVARKESYEGQNYTSARINTKNRLETTYGRFEARMQLPWGRGIWPAFWLLGANEDEVGWPACGEIDIMEYRGQEPFRIYGSLHGPGYSGSNPVTKKFDLYNDRFDSGFHTFAVEWQAGKITFYVDGTLYQTVNEMDVPGQWVFDHPFYILLNLAVGGDYVGPPDDNTSFPQTLLIDYVRVYEAES
jgi:beta-glucanase (GH16 family)